MPPTPDGAQTAFGPLHPPASPGTYNDWNVYTQSYEAGTTLGGVPVGGLSLLALSNQEGAYPITGVSFLQAYSCYADPTGKREPALKNWLAWFFGGSDAGLPSYSPTTSNASAPGYDPNVALVIRNNGFHELDPVWSAAVLATYVTPSNAGGSTAAIAAIKASGPNIDGCEGVTGGAK